MATQTQGTLFLVNSGGPSRTTAAAPRRDRWFMALAVAGLLATLAALARPVEKRTVGADEQIPSILID